MTVTAGDIVEHRGAFFAVIGLERSVPMGFPPDALLSNGKTQLRVSTAALTVITSATWQIGQLVHFPTGGHGHVTRDLGDVIEVQDERPAPALGKDAKYISLRDNFNSSSVVQFIGRLK